MEKIFEQIQIVLEDKYLKALAIVLVALVIAKIVRVLYRIITKLAVKKTKTELDDKIIAAFYKPVFYSVFLFGLIIAIRSLQFSETVNFVIFGLIKTTIALLWCYGFFKTSSILLNWFSDNQDKFKFIQKKTLPLFDNMLKLLIIGGAFYFLFLIWKINVTAWIASAGILGLAIGFAAKDTLSNFFSGIFIMIDSPYKIGDFIVLDSGERGMVSMIGLRSTRILTLDDIELILPNAVIANAKITNESGGPTEKHRVRISVGVAYGSDVDLVKKVLTEIATANHNVCEEPEPKVRFREFGDSSLNFQLLCWIDKSAKRGQVIDELNTAIYKEFIKNKIEIPFPQMDLHIKDKGYPQPC